MARNPRSRTKTGKPADTPEAVDAAAVVSERPATSRRSRRADEPVETPETAPPADTALPEGQAPAEAATPDDEVRAEERTEPLLLTDSLLVTEASQPETPDPLAPDASTERTDEIEPILSPPSTESSDGSETPRPTAAPPLPPAAPRGSIGAMVLGGLLAATLGALVMLVFLPGGWRGTPAADAELTARITALEAADSSALEARIAALEGAPAADSTLADRLAALEANQSAPVDLGPLEGRLAALETAAPAEESVNAAIGALTTRLAELEAAIDARIAEGVSQAMSGERAALDTQAEDVAAQQARITAQTALAELMAAAESGEPAAAALARLPDAPETLAPLAEGIAPLPVLLRDFAPAARAALAAEPIAPDAGLGERVGDFFRAQTGARSLAPREGDDADAVLSRAEAALRSGDLPGTLRELDALTGEPAAAMGDWRARAEQRLAVLQALDDVRSQLDGE